MTTNDTTTPSWESRKTLSADGLWRLVEILDEDADRAKALGRTRYASKIRGRATRVLALAKKKETNR